MPWRAGFRTAGVEQAAQLPGLGNTQTRALWSPGHCPAGAGGAARGTGPSHPWALHRSLDCASVNPRKDPEAAGATDGGSDRQVICPGSQLVSTDGTPMVWLPVQTASTVQGTAAPPSRPPGTVSGQAGSSLSGGPAPEADGKEAPPQDLARRHEWALPALSHLHQGSTARRSRRSLM